MLKHLSGIEAKLGDIERIYGFSAPARDFQSTVETTDKMKSSKAVYKIMVILSPERIIGSGSGTRQSSKDGSR
jgi:hypothetical protein